MKFKAKTYLILSVIWAIVVLILSTISGNSFKKLPNFNIPHLDKFVHFTMYFVLAFLIYWAIKLSVKKNSFTSSPVVSTFVIVALYSGIMELLQGYVFTSRSMDIYDFMANCVGVVAGLLITYFFKRQNLNIN